LARELTQAIKRVSPEIKKLDGISYNID
jgi:hypothetical protein